MVGYTNMIEKGGCEEDKIKLPGVRPGSEVFYKRGIMASCRRGPCCITGKPIYRPALL